MYHLILQRILLRLAIVKNLTISGLDISENFDLGETNFNKLMVKIRGTSLFWAKFKLSIVIKTFPFGKMLLISIFYII